MKIKFRSSANFSALAVLLAIACAGCVLFHKHSAYRDIHKYATDGDATAMAADLADNPGDVFLRDDAGLTPLHLGALHCHTNVMALLLAKGANVNDKGKDGATPLHLAAQEGCTDDVLLLLDKGAEINARDNRNRTPLKRAEEWRQSATAKLLRQRGGTE